MNVSVSELQQLVMDWEAWRAVIHGVAKSRTWLSNWTELNWTPFLRVWVIKESACRCRRPQRCKFDTRVGKIPWRRKWQCPCFLGWEIPWTEEPCRYSPRGNKWVRYDLVTKQQQLYVLYYYMDTVIYFVYSVPYHQTLFPSFSEINIYSNQRFYFYIYLCTQMDVFQ